MADALIDASGVRRSWDTARRMAVRSWSPWLRVSASAAARSRSRRSSSSASRAAKAASTVRSSPLSPPGMTTSTRSSVTSTRSPLFGSVGSSAPGAASIDSTLPVVRASRTTNAADSWPNVIRMWPSMASSGLAGPASRPATAASASASARARRASLRRRAVWLTSTLVVTPSATNTTRARICSGSSTSSVEYGSMKNQLVRPAPMTAATIPGQMPPTPDDEADERQEEEEDGRDLGRVAHQVQQDGQQRQTDQGEHPPGDLAVAGQRGASEVRHRWQPAILAVVDLVGDHVHVDPARQADRLVDDRPSDQLRPATPATGAEDELGRLHRRREPGQGRRDVVADDLVVLAAEIGQQPAVRFEQFVARLGEPVARPGSHAEQITVGTLGHAGGPTDEVVRTGGTGDGDHDTLACLPGSLDPVVLHVLLERVVDVVGHPQQGELAEGRQVARPEVVRQGGVDPIGSVDVAVGHAAANRLGSHVDQLDLIRLSDDPVGHRLLLADIGDPLDDVVERFEVLDVDGADHVDAGVEELHHVLPTLLVAGARARWCGRARRPARRRAAGRARRRCPSPPGPFRGRSWCAGGAPRGHRSWRRSGPGHGSRRNPTTTSVPRSTRRRASSSMAKVLPTPGAAPR